MDVLAGLAELLRLWLEGASGDEIRSSRGFGVVMGLAAWLIPLTVIALGIGLTEWRETPLAVWLGFSPRDPDSDWAVRARDIDKDGAPDF